MKILVAIANYGIKNDVYLSSVLSEYRRMPYQTDIVVLSNVPKDLGSDIEVVAGMPSKNPHSLPFGHKHIFAERKDVYDLFIYTEDDIRITQRNIEAFLRVTNLLPPHEVAGLFRWEQYPDGTTYYPDAHGFYQWMPDSVKLIGDHTFARFTNEHSGCYMLTRSQLAQAIRSGGFVVPPHEHRYRLLESAATDPYTQCGFRKVICLSHFDEFLVPHLPNKYIGSRLGLDASEFSKQLDVLGRPSQSCDKSGSLLEPETKVFHSEWSKDQYEPCRRDLITLFPGSTRAVLSIGCGWGETEAALVRKGIEVIAIPLNSVIAACAESRGVKIVYGGLEVAMAQLRGRRFDGVLMSGILHLLPDPDKALSHASSVLTERGVLIATVPTFHRLPFLWLWLRHPSRYRGWRDFRRSGVHPLGRREARASFRNAGLSLKRIPGTIPERWKTLVAWTGGLAEAFFSSEYTFIGRRGMSKHSAVTEPSEPEPQVTFVSERIKSMKVSAVITAFNRRRYIVRAIDSVMRQTVPVDEIVVVDDGSTDGTAEVVESHYGDTVKVVRQPNGGPGGARRRGILEARGEWIAFLDSDDEWTPDRNGELLRAAERLPTDVAWIFGDLQIVTDDGKTSSFFKQHCLSLKESPQVIPDPLEFQYPTLFSYLQASLIRREALLELGCFKEGFRSEDDVLAAIQIGCRYKVAAISSTVVKYYRTADLAASSVAIHGALQPDAYRARMVAFATAIKSGRKRPWNSEYASAVRGLCKTLEESALPPRVLALEQFRYGGFSFKSISFLCIALTGRHGVQFWNALASLRTRILYPALTDGHPRSSPASPIQGATETHSCR